MATTSPATTPAKSEDDVAASSHANSSHDVLLPPPPHTEVMRYVARQPILDASGHTHGYELLFRSGPTMVVFSGDGDQATRTVLDNTVLFGLNNLTAGYPAFINCTKEALLERLVMVLPAEQTVLEILETLEPTPELLEACRELKLCGYRIALDDFEWAPAWEPFVKLADYVKVDISKSAAHVRARLYQRLDGCKAKLIAERVETHADLEMAQREGFTLFQGYFFCRPILVENRLIPSNKLIGLRILKLLHDEPLDIRQVSELVKLDTSLTYRLLRMVNSPLYALRSQIRSIRDAIVMIGDEMFRRVATLAIATELKGDSSPELLRMAFLRARFCELAASATCQDPREQYLLGILSLLHAMLRVPVDGLIDSLPLREAIRNALLGQNNPESFTLNWLESYEQGEWESCDRLAAEAGQPTQLLTKLHAEALIWAETNVKLAGI